MAKVKNPGHSGKHAHTEYNKNENTVYIAEVLKEPVIFQVEPVKDRGEVISKLITSSTCIYEDALVNEVADAMSS